jgi:hypothetical protein
MVASFVDIYSTVLDFSVFINTLEKKLCLRSDLTTTVVPLVKITWCGWLSVDTIIKHTFRGLWFNSCDKH